MKLYWYCFSFMELNQFATVYKGLEQNIVLLKDIDDAKTAANASRKSALLGVSYLGYCTKEEMVEGSSRT